ncbi:hypothetical protein QJQ45_025124 [Haematococcus lacustris]|nr:hypothetical protein QJQ45_025124 [Haematococcus lacustris]
MAVTACIATVVGEGLPPVPGPSSGSMPDEPPPRASAAGCRCASVHEQQQQHQASVHVLQCMRSSNSLYF